MSRVHVVYSHPWCVSHTKEIHISHDKIFIVTQDFLNGIFKVEEDEYKKDLLDTYTERFGSDIRVIEKNIFQARVNGYPMDAYMGKKTKVFDISTHISFCAESITEAVVGCIEKYTHISHSSISFHTLPFATFSVLNQMYSNADLVYMDVSAEATTVSVIRGGVLAQSTSFPSGTRFVIRQIENLLNVSSEIAVSMLHLVLSEKGDSTLTEQVMLAVQTAEKEWAVYFEDALKTLDPDIVLPTKIFLVTSDAMEKVYAEFIGTPHTDSTMQYRKEVHIISVSDTVLSASYEHVAREHCDDRLAMSVVFVS